MKSIVSMAAFLNSCAMSPDAVAQNFPYYQSKQLSILVNISGDRPTESHNGEHSTR